MRYLVRNFSLGFLAYKKFTLGFLAGFLASKLSTLSKASKLSELSEPIKLRKLSKFKIEY